MQVLTQNIEPYCTFFVQCRGKPLRNSIVFLLNTDVSPPYISTQNDMIVLVCVPPVCKKHSLLLLWKSSLKGLLWRPSLLHRVATTTALSCHWGGGGVRQGWFTHHLKAETEEEITWPHQNNDVNALRGEINLSLDWMSHKGLCGCKSQSEYSLQGMGYWYHEDYTGY